MGNSQNEMAGDPAVLQSLCEQSDTFEQFCDKATSVNRHFCPWCQHSGTQKMTKKHYRKGCMVIINIWNEIHPDNPTPTFRWKKVWDNPKADASSTI